MSGRKTAIIIIIIFAIIAIASAFVISTSTNEGHNNSISGNYDDNGTNPEPEKNETPVSGEKGLKIVIDYDGTFNAGYGSNAENDDITSSGYLEIDLDNATFVNVGASKADDSNRELTLSIVKDSKVVKEGSTSSPYGEIKLHYKDS